MQRLLWTVIVATLFVPHLSPLALAQSPGVQDPFAEMESNEAKDPLLDISASLSPDPSHAAEIAKLAIHVVFANGYKVYVDEFRLQSITPKGVQVGELDASPKFVFYDKFSKKEREAVEGQVTINAILQTPPDLELGAHELVLGLTYQACSDEFCLFPKTKEFTIPVTIKEGETHLQDFSEGETSGVAKSTFEAQMQKGLLFTFIFVFFAGVLTSFTPCIFPMIPITLAILTKGASKRSRFNNFLLSVTYVLGIAVTYSALGVLAASTGAMFGAALSHPIIVGTIAIIFFTMAASMYGAFDIQPPAFIRNRLGQAETGTGYKGAFGLGLLAGIIASPCVGPVLVGILAYVAQTQDILLGSTLLFTFALGLGQLFLLLGISGEIGRFLPKSGAWMEAIKFFFGTLMLGVGFYYLDFLVPDTYWWSLLGLAMVIVASLFGAFLPPTLLNKSQLLQKGIMFAVFLAGVFLILDGFFGLRGGTSEAAPANLKSSTETSQWTEYSQEKFEQAAALGKPVIIDFHADWCIACKELEKYTFTDETFQAEAKDFVLLSFDATHPSDALSELSKTYGIVGLPTVLFFDRQGQWRKDLTVTGFETAEPFVQRMRQLTQPPVKPETN